MDKYLTIENAINAIIKYNPNYSPTVLRSIFERYGKFEDVEPVRHAHWIEHQKTVYLSSLNSLSKPKGGITIPDYYECSSCGKHEEFTPPYCNCGAKMDEKQFGFQYDKENESERQIQYDTSKLYIPKGTKESYTNSYPLKHIKNVENFIEEIQDKQEEEQ